MYQNPKAKGIYHAHNSHVGRDQVNGQADVAGRELDKELGSDYFTIKTDFGRGSFLAFPYNANEVGWSLDEQSYGELDITSFTGCLDRYSGNEKNLILDIKKAAAESDDLRTFLTKPVTEMAGAGAQNRSYSTEQVTLYPSYDALIYFGTITPITYER